MHYCWLIWSLNTDYASCRSASKNLHNHPFIWNKHTIHFQPARSSRKHVSIYLGFSVHLALLSFGAPRTHTSALQCASGQCWCEHAICTHTIRSTLAAVHTMPCLFITAWHMAMMLIDFIKASPHPPPLTTSPTPLPLPQTAASCCLTTAAETTCCYSK